LYDEVYDIVKDVGLPPAYKICIVGHSLGAGTAALLGILLGSRGNGKLQDPDYLQFCVFVCPPVLDQQSSLESKSFITTIVNNNDIVP
jgi:predicted lipase